MNYPIAEWFTSINGEGLRAGQLAFFIRLSGCPLNCHYCDTAWAREPQSGSVMNLTEIVQQVIQSGIRLVTLTGGEPLACPEIEGLIEALLQIEALELEVETSGAVSLDKIQPLRRRYKGLHLTVDYKLLGSGMTAHMQSETYRTLFIGDAVKYVISHPDELPQILSHIESWQADSPEARILLSPVYGQLEASLLVDWLKENAAAKWQPQAQVQLQLHKYIWEPNRKGV